MSEVSFRFAAVVEQNLGHRTHYENLRRYLPAPDAEIAWLPVAYRAPTGLYRLPALGNVAVRASLDGYRAVRAARRTGAFDAVLYHTQTTGLLSPLPRVPAVVSLDATPINFDTLARYYGHRVGGPLEGVKRAIYRRVFARAAALISWSQWAKDSLVRDYGIAGEKVTVVHPGVDLAGWPHPDAQERLARTDGPVKLLFVGGDFQRKGGELLLRGFRERLESRCELHIVTQTALEPSPNGHVYRGVTPNSPTLRRLYAEADLFVFPTFADCLPQVVPEAMAAGLPVVTTRVGAAGEVVEDGATGLLVEPGDGAGLLRAMEALVERRELRCRMGEASRRSVARSCDAQVNAGRILAVLKGASLRQGAARGATALG